MMPGPAGVVLPCASAQRAPRGVKIFSPDGHMLSRPWVRPAAEIGEVVRRRLRYSLPWPRCAEQVPGIPAGLFLCHGDYGRSVAVMVSAMIGYRFCRTRNPFAGIRTWR